MVKDILQKAAGQAGQQLAHTAELLPPTTHEYVTVTFIVAYPLSCTINQPGKG
jgi:hypothetical protein